ncbi:Uncharacterised protein [Legionella lansingensis]|uniref:Uncharacterized protein n=1 Tax=Legionella lansingensis TaxID=45067 RepID=A0A0W0VFI3_9GAMM|nr:hypothetical protein [Legionella lansingensis]KTD18858.1 hypothetical protein Llan_2461 [Legionella lansingensis]SNV52750.1 Uncharacterised protein [Legionella lansingensis]
MPYYLSYIQINGHGGLMLAEQAKSSEAARIICNVGFNPRYGKMFGEGYLAEELTADRAIFYPYAKVFHRTYEISKAEMEKFFSIINRERRINAATLPSKQASSQAKHVGGPDFNIFAFNCKTFAMSVFKEMGIIDAEHLSNFLVQRTIMTSGDLLKPLTKHELSCPLKEEVFSLAARLNTELASFKKSLADKKINPQMKDQLIQEILWLCGALLADGSQREYKKALNEKFEKLSPLLESKLFSKHKDFPKDLKLLVERVNEIDQLIYQRQLNFYWKTTPPVAERLNLDNFNNEEKAIYLTKVKINETSDGLKQILQELIKKRGDAKSSNPDLYSDLTHLAKIIVDAKKSVDAIKKEFDSLDQKKPEDIISECAKQQRALNSTIHNMEQNLSKFIPRTQETSVFMRFINRIVAYFTKDFFIEDVCSAVEENVSNIKQSMAKGRHAFFRAVEPKQEEVRQPGNVRAIRDKFTHAMAVERAKAPEAEHLSPNDMNLSN